MALCCQQHGLAQSAAWPCALTPPCPLLLAPRSHCPLTCRCWSTNSITGSGRPSGKAVSSMGCVSPTDEKVAPCSWPTLRYSTCTRVQAPQVAWLCGACAPVQPDPFFGCAGTVSRGARGQGLRGEGKAVGAQGIRGKSWVVSMPGVCACACMNVCMHAFLSAHVCACAFVCVHACACAGVRACMSLQKKR